MMSDIQIQIKGISSFGYHGVFEHEKVNGQEFIVDLELDYEANKALSSDNLVDTVDYGEIVKAVKNLVETTRRDLIEVLANDLADMLLNFKLIKRVKVILHKPYAPVEVKVTDIAVIVEKAK
jgi:dihydroneopterin aldolase